VKHRRVSTPAALAGASWLVALALTPATARPVEDTPGLGPRPACDAVSLEQDLRSLASDGMEGRGLGSEGLERALRLVARRFKALGLRPAFPEKELSGGLLDGYFQEFAIEGHPPSANVIGILPGDSTVVPRALVVGAHVDHLGRDPGREGDQIFNGADDNASGVAALLAIARMLAEAPVRQQERTVVCVVFSGEESGLLGSRYYTEHPVVPLDQVIAMINLDSIGRLRDNQLILFGTGTAREFPAILEGVNQAFGLALAMRGEGAGASDQVSFFQHDLPVLHLFTGAHPDDHRVTDEADLIHYTGLATVADFAGELVRYLRYRSRPLNFVAAGREQAMKMQQMAQGGERKVSLGFMPDFAQASGGVKVGAVTPGGAAAAAGLQAGDLITAVDDESVNTLVDYTALLREHAPGDRVTLTVFRAGATLHIEATVQERK
jgi:aminopeptidase N